MAAQNSTSEDSFCLNTEGTFICHVCGIICKTRQAIKKHVRLKGHNGLPGVNAKTSLPISVPQEWNWTIAASKPDTLTILVPMKNVEDTKKWMSEFMAMNNCKYIIRSSKSSSDIKRDLIAVHCGPFNCGLFSVPY